jgi:transglutaminase-like putative cysteine protease
MRWDSRRPQQVPKRLRAGAFCRAPEAVVWSHVYFWIAHESWYRYDVPVQLAPHLLRLTPRLDTLRIVAQRLSVEPFPSARDDELDAFGNALTRVSFTGQTQTLRVHSQLELETFPPPPLQGQLAPLTRGTGWACHPDVRAFAERLASDVYDDPIAFLDHMSQTLFTRTRLDDRTSGDARPPHETLQLGVGACRDLAVLFLDAARALGLSGRFVSGYRAQPNTPEGPSHLHAWAEILLPGFGQRGWDPMHGTRVDDGYVPLCAAPTQAATMPIDGGFFFDGPTVNATLDYTLRIATH